MNNETNRSTAPQPFHPLHEADYRALTACISQLMWAAGPDGSVDFLSEQWSAFTGIPLGELQGLPWEALVHPEDREEVLARWQASLREGTALEMRFRLKDASGSWRWQLSRSLPVRAVAGRVERWVGTLTDIHDQVIAEQDAQLLDDVGERCRRATNEGALVQQVAERLGRYLAADHCVFAELEVAGRVAHVRHDFHSGEQPLVGSYPLETCAASSLDTLLAGKTIVVSDAAADARVRSIGAAFINAPSHIDGELRGTLLVLSSVPRAWSQREVRLVETAGERSWLAVQRLRDLEAHHGREAELLAARNEAERLRGVAETANRTKDEFLAIVSHELRAPLNAIGGWAGVLRVGKLDAAGIAKAATVIEKNVRAQAKMIEDLLDVSRIVSGKLRLERRAFDPAVSVDGAIEALRPTANEKNIRLDHAKSTATRSISGDPHRLQQAVWNLISNAVKFTEAGGQVRVTLGQRDGAVEITVSDTGIGIAPDLLPHIFKRFQQADGSHQRRFGGLGLGLGIVRHIVELHGGTVEARSPGEGRGATFVIRIPIALEAGAQLPAEPAPRAAEREAGSAVRAAARPGALAGLRLLSVDDEADASEMLKAALEQYGAKVTTVTSAAAALDILEREPFDVLVSDIGMPGMNGYELLERIRAGDARVRGIPAIAVTGYARSEDRERAFQAGYEAHVVKPIEPEELAATVRAAATGSAARQ